MKKSSKNGTLKHINNVQLKISTIIQLLVDRGMNHDRSKLEEPELSTFDKFTPKLKPSSFGTDKYNSYKKKMEPALDHHYQENRHHPEHFKKYICDACFKEYKTEPDYCECLDNRFTVKPAISGMNIVDLVEMFCDWIAATERHNDGDIYKSIEYCKDKYKINEQLCEIFRNTANDIFDKKSK